MSSSSSSELTPGSWLFSVSSDHFPDSGRDSRPPRSFLLCRKLSFHKTYREKNEETHQVKITRGAFWLSNFLTDWLCKLLDISFLLIAQAHERALYTSTNLRKQEFLIGIFNLPISKTFDREEMDPLLLVLKSATDPEVGLVAFTVNPILTWNRTEMKIFCNDD